METSDIPLRPILSRFLFSLRDIGYSLDTAVADVVDNSITARAHTVRISVMPSLSSMCIYDDGYGMNKEELLTALRLGSSKDTRDEGDLGRFGLGLKTASFSQCRKLTLISKSAGMISGYCWDLDFIAERNDWIIKEADMDACKSIVEKMPDDLWNVFISGKTGTLVLWEKIDRYTDEGHFTAELSNLTSTLALTFHRYLDTGGYKKHKIDMYFNGIQIKPFDPFASSNRASQMSAREEHVLRSGEKIYITPYVLPHHSRLKNDEYKELATKDGFTRTQGFYLYREGRLLIYGTWFGLACIQDSSSLVRIQIDINNKQDDLWQIDVKKCKASPVPEIKKILSHYIINNAERSKRVYQHKGVRVKTTTSPYWQELNVGGKISFKINRDHPILRGISDTLSPENRKILSNFIESLEEFLPKERIHGIMATDPFSISNEENSVTKEQLMLIIKLFRDSGFSDDEIYDKLSNDERYQTEKSVINELIKGKDNG